MQPRQIRDTSKPVRPSFAYSMYDLLGVQAGSEARIRCDYGGLAMPDIVHPATINGEYLRRDKPRFRCCQENGSIRDVVRSSRAPDHRPLAHIPNSRLELL